MQPGVERVRNVAECAQGLHATHPRVPPGNPCIWGARICVSLLLDFLASGATTEEILADYPHLQ
jgi:uncharacterized protein (DUF433 family)